MNTLDRWEADAKDKVFTPNWSTRDESSERILRLINLVRKKDEALKFYAELDWKPNTELWQLNAKEALALTEELK